MRTLALALLVSAAASAQDFAAKADEYVQSWVRDKQFRGAVLVAKDGKPLLRKAYGNANDEWEIANTPDTKFRLGSITKQFTAAAVLQLVEQGKVRLDDPIKNYYPEAPEAWDKITVHHLLNHTSGIPSYTGLPDFFPKMSRDARKPAEIVKLTQDKPLEFEPGEKFRYNNSGYILLGVVIEKASGMKYADYVRKNIFERLGMKDSGYDLFAPVIKKRATGYLPDGQHAPYLDMTLPYAAGSLYSTVDDLLKWDQALYTDKVLSKASFEKMTTPSLEKYGYGLVMDMVEGKQAQGHGGGINGFNTMIYRFPEDKATVIVLSNQNGRAGDVAKELARMYFGADVKPRPVITRIELAPEALNAFAGRYQIRPGFELKVWQEGGKMLTQATNQTAVEAVPVAENRFYVRMADGFLIFEKDSAGKTTGLVMQQGGRDTKAPRIGD